MFACIIAWIGCQRGFQVRGGVEEVGAATTSAVVTSILLIVIVDSVFAIVLHYLDERDEQPEGKARREQVTIRSSSWRV